MVRREGEFVRSTRNESLAARAKRIMKAKKAKDPNSVVRESELRRKPKHSAANTKAKGKTRK